MGSRVCVIGAVVLVVILVVVVASSSLGAASSGERPRGGRRGRLFVRDGPYRPGWFLMLAKNKALLDFRFVSVSFL